MLRHIKNTALITDMEKDKKTMQYIKSLDKRKKMEGTLKIICVCLGVANPSIEIIKVEIKNYRIL